MKKESKIEGTIKIIKIIFLNPNILIITLNINGLIKPTKGTDYQSG